MNASVSKAAVIACVLVAGACGGGDQGEASEPQGAAQDTADQAPAAASTGGTGAPATGMQTRATSNSSAGAAAPSSKPAAAAGSPASAPAAAGGSAPAMMSAGAAGQAGSTDASAGASAAAGAAGAPAMPAAACDRACLTGFSDSYLSALTSKDATQLKTASAVRFTENGKELPLTEGLWAVAGELGPYRQDFAEVPAGQTAGFVSLQDDRGDVLLAFRLKVENMEVTEIETTVCRTGEATFFSPNALEHNPLFDEEIPADARMERDKLSAIVDTYFAGIESSDGSNIPFATTARRNENGVNTGSGTGLQNVAMFSYIDTIDRRYVLVDSERGAVLPWVLFQIPSGLGGSRTLHLAEAFKVEDGKIMDVQAIMVNQPFGTPGGWE
jgi:hypothetical protein